MKVKFIIAMMLLTAVCGWCSEAPLVLTVNKNFPPFSFLNVESKPAGVFVDIWRLWAEKTGREIEFRPERWVDTLKCFKSGEADIHGGLFRTGEREKWMAFSRPFYTIDNHLIYLSSLGEITSPGELAGQRVGVHHGTFQEAWLREHFPDVEAAPMMTTRELILAAKKGKIRAFMADAQTIWTHLYQLGLSSEFKTAPHCLYLKAYHAGVLKADTKLLELVNDGFAAISDSELAEIETRWLRDPKYPLHDAPRIRLEFSDLERVFIQSHSVVRAGLIPGFEPYMIDGEDGAIHGIIPDYLGLIEEKTGLRIENVPIDLSKLDEIMGSDIDLFPGNESPERLKRMAFTKTILTDPWVLVNREETPLIMGLRDLKGQRISFVKGIYLQNRLKSEYPDIRMLPANDHMTALKKVSQGQADAYIGPLSVAGCLIRNHRLTNLKIAAPSGYPDVKVKFGVRKDLPELVSVLDKAISAVTRRELDEIYQKWIFVKYEHKVDWKHVWKWIGGVVAGLGFLLLVSLWWNRKLSQEIRERKKAEHALRQIEWLLTRSVTPPDLKINDYNPPYGDVTELNTCRVILDAVGKDALRHIAEDTIDLLETSVAIYEENGDYAFGMFSSGWCRLFDLGSRNLCETSDNREALTCGKWLCHENCWNDSAKTAMQSGKPTDIECVGGIRLYAVPIFAETKVIGAINIGYGDPPENDDTLSKLANRFNLSLDEVRKASAEYQSRPKYIIELAKKRLQTAADLIGEIVERKKNEDALRESEENLALIFANMPTAVFFHDLDGRILMTNRMTEIYTGYTRDELLNLTVADIDRQSVTRDDRKHIWEQLQHGGYQKIESIHFRKDGSRYSTEIHISALTVRNESVILGMAQDITDRKHFEAALKESEEQYRTVIETSLLGVALRRGDKLIFANQAFCDMLGRTEEELLRTTATEFTTIIHPVDRQTIYQRHLDRVAGKAVPSRYEYRYIRKNGSIVWVDVMAQTVLIGGQPAQIGMYVDITDRKEAEARLNEYSKNLEEMVKERTKELENAQEELLVKERLAVLGHFSGSISHELRNPLAVIDSSSYFLKMKLGGSNEKIDKHLEFISENVQKSTAIIQSLLNLSQMEKPKTEKINLAGLISETLSSAKIPETVEAIRNFPESELFVDVEPEQIRMALKNLIQNAVQAMNDAGTLTFTAQTLESAHVELVIADTGPGISPEHLEKVFEPLFSTKTHGIGFGLSITRMIIENHGGTIRAESKSESGAAFIITLPLTSS